MIDQQVALLSGINVGKAKRIAMADLRELFEDLGYKNVRTLLNSGNVVFEVVKKSGRDDGARIEKAIEGQFGAWETRRVPLVRERHHRQPVMRCGEPRRRGRRNCTQSGHDGKTPGHDRRVLRSVRIAGVSSFRSSKHQLTQSLEDDDVNKLPPKPRD